jgi:hypothetical protein
MRKIWITALMVMAVLMLSSVIPMTSVVGKPMPDPNGQELSIYVTYTPPTLDGVVHVGSEWPTVTFVGQSKIRDSPSSYTPTADVYAVVEVGTSLTDFEFLWIGMDMLDGFYLHPDNGNWLLIDWDQDGTVDVEDTIGQTYSYGEATAAGVEWCIPWNTAHTSNKEDETPITEDIEECCFNIYVHLQVYWWDDGEQTETSRWPEGGIDNNGDGDTTDPGDDHDGDGLLNSEDDDDDNDGVPDDEDNTPFGDPTGGGAFDSTTLCPDKEVPPEDPPEGDGWGLRTIGFWKHQLRCALGANGHQHVPTGDLMYYLDEIDELSEIDEYTEMSLQDALDLLELRGKHSMYDKAVQQFLATMLNYVSDGDQPVDTDWDGTQDMDLSEAIDMIESILTDPNPSDEDLEWAKEAADSINNFGDE